MPLDTPRDSPADELGCTAGFGTGTTPASYSHSVGAGRPFHAACRKHASQGLIPSQRTRLLAPRKGRSDQFSPLSEKPRVEEWLSHVRQASVRGVDVVWCGWVRLPTRLVELMAGATATRRGVDLSQFWILSSFGELEGNMNHPKIITRNSIFDDHKKHPLPESVLHTRAATRVFFRLLREDAEISNFQAAGVKVR